MGYDVHITRADSWAENEGHEIAGEEWLAIVQADSELTHSIEDGPYFVRWHGTTKYPETWFDLVNGNIDTKNPDKATMRKMLQIANALGANVQGDDGEIYGELECEMFDDSYLDSQVFGRVRCRCLFLMSPSSAQVRKTA